ncbi:FAD-binding protein [uncultured Dokdonia sp.]|uniref:FAD-dependent oxidoreductase n=1 Tax=uncultured Dokdonia sp. TaxID=575653 RepID=UPI002628CD7D|nr:FAD-binding protein [uncultured Dokdonia sp.]
MKKHIDNLVNSAPDDLKIISIGDPLYQYARVISNTRFGHMPISIAYCSKASHVQFCIQFCRDFKLPFRVRSGGHQHEGMSSGDGVIIIDLSEMDTIEYIDHDHAWIPVGKQLGKVYEELEKRGQIIPGGGCQSVNVGGLTQGGGWGLSIRKYGMTCDSVVECELILPDGTIAYPSPDTMPDLFWALKGGGGGNFGVVTRFRFKLSSLGNVTTSFSLLWKNGVAAVKAMKIWTVLHADLTTLDANLSTACGMMVADPKDVHLPEGHVSAVHARMGGLFYGSKKALLALLHTHFGDLIPKEDDFVSLQEKHHTQLTKRAVTTQEKNQVSLSRHQSVISEFVNPTVAVNTVTHTTCGDRDYRVLPDAPSSTCDKPHPHKVTSGFPKATTATEHHQLVDAIYNYLGHTCFYVDVNRYMSFHCLGGAVTNHPEQRVFAFSNKPYLLQIQCWWDDAGNAFTNVARNEAYVQWVIDFRKSLLPHIAHAFINFIDKTLVPDPSTTEGRKKLLAMYYGDNFQRLCEIKTAYDPTNLFDFEMSIPLVK